MSVATKTIYVLVTLYLLSGVPNLLGHVARNSRPSPLAAIYLLCVALGISGFYLGRQNASRMSRLLVLVAIGIPSLLFASQRVRIAYPTYFHVPLTFVTKYPNGQATIAGIDLLPAVLFVVLWMNAHPIASRRILGPDRNSNQV